MERLTEKGFNYSDAAIVENMRMATVSAVMNRLAAYEDTGLTPEEITDFLPTLKEWRQNMGALRHVHELVTAESEGRLLVLPCRVGDTVWRIKKGICAEKKDVCFRRCMCRNDYECLPGLFWKAYRRKKHF